MKFLLLRIVVVALFILTGGEAAEAWGQGTAAARELGSRTAKAGFRNEDEIAAKFRDWRSDAEAREWLAVMGYDRDTVTGLAVSKPHGEKADIMVAVTTRKGSSLHGISIKLVSNATGFNQIDKRWLGQYAGRWRMPDDVAVALRKFTGEDPPSERSRDPHRMFLNEFSSEMQQRIVEFFSDRKQAIVSDLIKGEGDLDADWFLVAVKSAGRPRWRLVSAAEAIRFFSDGPVVITRSGNLKIGRVSMQRKGGDGGRETANMLQFKINPALLLEVK